MRLPLSLECVRREEEGGRPTWREGESGDRGEWGGPRALMTQTTSCLPPPACPCTTRCAGADGAVQEAAAAERVRPAVAPGQPGARLWGEGWVFGVWVGFAGCRATGSEAPGLGQLGALEHPPTQPNAAALPPAGQAGLPQHLLPPARLDARRALRAAQLCLCHRRVPGLAGGHPPGAWGEG